MSYHNFAERYAATMEQHPIRLYYDMPATLALLGEVKGLHVLDAGCGPGGYTEWLVGQGAQVTAFDLMPEFVEMTRQHQAEVYQADLAQPLTFAADASFDLILSVLTLHYVQDWRAVFGEFRRVLRPGGKLIFSCMHPFTDTQAVNYFETALYEMVWVNFGEPYPVMQVYHRPLGEILNPLTQAGFSLEVLHEPLPTAGMAAVSPQEYQDLCEKPIFLYVKARANA